MSIERLHGLITAPDKERWTTAHQVILDSFFGASRGRYPEQAGKAFKLPAPAQMGSPFAACLHPANSDSGAYSGASLPLAGALRLACLRAA